MTIKVKKIMEEDENGVKCQVYPQTHASAILGLKDEEINIGVMSINGKSGNVNLRIEDLAPSDMMDDLKTLIEKMKQEDGSQGEYDGNIGG